MLTQALKIIFLCSTFFGPLCAYRGSGQRALCGARKYSALHSTPRERRDKASKITAAMKAKVLAGSARMRRQKIAENILAAQHPITYFTIIKNLGSKPYYSTKQPL